MTSYTIPHPSSLNLAQAHQRIPEPLQLTNLIFLDIDGVLNSDRSFIAFSDQTIYRIDLNVEAVKTIDPVSVGLLNNLIKKSHAKIVVSSSHRKFFKNDIEMQELKLYISRLGVTGTVIGMTPDIPNAPRGKEIRAWIESWCEKGNNVGRYLILDDSPDILEDQQENFVRTCVSNGFLTEHYYKACKILGVQVGASND